jgi:hypothetical protein
MRLCRSASAPLCLACSCLIGCVDRFATRELRVIEPRGVSAGGEVDYSAVPQQYVRRVEKLDEKGQPVTVLYLQTRVKVMLVPLSD